MLFRSVSQSRYPEEYRQEAKYLAAESYEAVTGLNLDPDIAYRVRPAAEVAQHMRSQQDKREQKRIDGEARVRLKRRKL